MALFAPPTLGGKQLWADVFLHAGYRIQEQVYTSQCRLLGPNDRRWETGTYMECRNTFERMKSEHDLKHSSTEAVLLLHGIFRAKDAFGPMTRSLRTEGFQAWSVNYPSTRQSLADHAEGVERLLNSLEGIEKIHLVTHSMGGLLARLLLARNAEWRQRIEVQRLVMIATPNQGAEIADMLQPLAATALIGGPSMQDLTTESVRKMPKPDVPFGIVAGVKGDGAGFNPLLSGEDDMTVALEETFLDGAEDELFVKAIHTFVMSHPDVITGTIRYLRTGCFTEAILG